MILQQNFKAYRLTGCLWAVSTLLWIFCAHPALAGEKAKPVQPSASNWSLPIKFFQKTISRADGDRCPMYPSCSQYADQVFKKHGALKGWILTSDRLLRCGHDEVRLSPKVRVKGKIRTFDPPKANTRWWSKP